MVGDFNKHLSTIYVNLAVTRNGVSIQNQLYFSPLATNIKQHFKTETIKLLEDNIRENLDDLEFGDDFFNTTPKARATKEITDKLDFIKIENL